MDLETEFLALGHKFKHLAVMFGGDEEGEEGVRLEDVYNSGGEVEVWYEPDLGSIISGFRKLNILIKIRVMRALKEKNYKNNANTVSP